MQFKESVKYYLNRSNMNEMALKHLEGTQEMWDKNDLDGVADKYIENAMTDGKNFSNILRGLTATFKSKGFDHNRKNAEKVRDLIREKTRELQKQDKEEKEREASKEKSILIKKTSS